MTINNDTNGNFVNKTFFALHPLNIKYRDNAYVLYHTETGRWIKTNQSGKNIVELCDGKLSVQEIAFKIAQKLMLPEEDILESIVPFMKGAEEIKFLLEAEQNTYKKESIQTIDAHVKLDLWVHVTSRCNMKCPFCIQGGSKPENHKSLMNTSDYLSLFNDVKGVKRLKILFSGGEPFLREDIKELVTRCREIVGSEAYIVLISNGTGAEPEVYGLLSKYVDILQISLDGRSSNTNDIIRGEGSFEKTMTTVKYLRDIRAKNLWLSFTPTQYNIKDLASMVNFALRLNAAGLHVNSLMPGGCALDNYNKLVVDKNTLRQSRARMYHQYQSQMGWLRKHFGSKSELEAAPNFRLDPAAEPAGKLALLTKRYSCGMGRFLVSLDPMGNMYLCPSLHVDDFRYGNILENGFWGSYENMIKELPSIDVRGIDGCKDCDIRYICGGGCRARAYYLNKGIDKIDPNCNYDDYIDRMFTIAPYVVRTDQSFRIKATEQYNARSEKAC